MAFNPWQNISKTLEGGGQPEDVIGNILRDYKGKQKHLRTAQREAGPFAAGALFNTPAYKYLQDWQNRSDVGQQFGQVAGQIGQQGRQFMDTRQSQLGLQGLGRSSAQAAVAQQAVTGTENAQAGAFADLQARQQEMQVLFAQQAFDVDQAIAQLVLSSIPGYQPRQSSGGGTGSAIGGALGTIGGAFLGGPFGAAAGGGAGGALGSLF